ncbi:MAG: M23 family metallopeptidase [Ignavibacteriaceae bacterium]
MNKLKTLLQNLLSNINFKRLKKIKSFSLIIIPEEVGLQAKSKKFTVKYAAWFLILYTLILLIAGFYFINFTPLKGIFAPGRSGLSVSDIRMLDELNRRVIFLTRDLENLKTTNEQLKNALILGDSTLVDSLSRKKSTTNQINENPFGGDIFSIIKKIISEKLIQNGEGFHFIYPTTGFISRGFMPGIGHMGIDFVVKVGTPVYAAASGYVVFAGYTVSDGYMLILSHPGGYITVYKHCSVLLKKARDVVLEGETIALSGNTGELTTGPHLHFEIWKDGKPIDPINLLTNY